MATQRGSCMIERSIDPRDPNADPAPARTNQIDGISGANDAPPQGALDNPYTRPR